MQADETGLHVSYAVSWIAKSRENGGPGKGRYLLGCYIYQGLYWNPILIMDSVISWSKDDE